MNDNNIDKPKHVSIIADPYDNCSKKSQISWACKVDDIGLLGLCDSDRNKFILWRTIDANATTNGDTTSGTNNTTTTNNISIVSSSSVSLAPLDNPVGAFQSSVEGWIYSACFGTSPNQHNDSGVVIVEIVSTAKNDSVWVFS